MSSSPSYVEDLLATIREIGKEPVSAAVKPTRLACNNGSVSGHHNGNVVTPKGLELVNHYRGGYHYFTIEE